MSRMGAGEGGARKVEGVRGRWRGDPYGVLCDCFGNRGYREMLAARPGWDCSIVAHFAVAAGIRSGDADRVGVDIESDIEYGSGHRHGVLAVFYLFVCAAASCRWRPNMRLCSFGNNPRLLTAGTPPSIKAGALGAGRGTGRSHRVY
jgi:hypothetical protein